MAKKPKRCDREWGNIKNAVTINGWKKGARRYDVVFGEMSVQPKRILHGELRIRKDGIRELILIFNASYG